MNSACDQLLAGSGKTLVKFEERPKDSPEAIESWFYPGDNYEFEFVYRYEKVDRLIENSGIKPHDREVVGCIGSNSPLPITN